MQYTIQSDKLTVTLSSLGAELISVKKGEKEYIWQNPTGEWEGHAPILFPVCGNCAMTVDGVSYPIPFHGVARRAEFTIEKQSENSLTFALFSTEETKKVFPFAFIFRVIYTVNGDTLSIAYAVENPADKDLYFACGSHEAYALDGAVNEYEVEFDKEETLVNYLTNENRRLTGETVALGDYKIFPLPVEYLCDNNTLIFKNIRSHAVLLRKIGGENIAKITFDGFDNLLFWHALDANYICIEPWTNLPDIEGKENIEFSQKEGVMKVAPNTVKTLTRTITLF